MKKLIVLSFIAALVLSTGLVFAADQAATVPSVSVSTAAATPAKAVKVKKVKKVKAAKKAVVVAPVAK